MNNKFALSHLVLYSKNWYKRYDFKSKRKTIWDDLKIILALDGFSNSCLVNHRPFTIREFAHNIQPDNSWKYRYSPQPTEYNYQEAVVRYIISELTFLEKEQWYPIAPNYSKMPRANGTSDELVKEHFQ